jgi:hypothetical protein
MSRSQLTFPSSPPPTLAVALIVFDANVCRTARVGGLSIYRTCKIVRTLGFGHLLLVCKLQAGVVTMSLGLAPRRTAPERSSVGRTEAINGCYLVRWPFSQRILIMTRIAIKKSFEDFDRSPGTTAPVPVSLAPVFCYDMARIAGESH